MQYRFNVSQNVIISTIIFAVLILALEIIPGVNVITNMITMKTKNAIFQMCIKKQRGPSVSVTVLSWSFLLSVPDSPSNKKEKLVHSSFRLKAF